MGNTSEVEEVETCRCDFCNAWHDRGDMQAVNSGNDIICRECEQDSFECDDCGDIRHNNDSYRVRHRGVCSSVCNSCFDNDYFHCGNCEEYLHNDVYGHDGLCESCADDSDGSDGIERNPDISCLLYQSNEAGNIVKSMRKWSFEIESVASDNNDVRDVLNTFEGLGGVHDGSIESDDGVGVEWVSPILKGLAGEKLAIDLTKKLKDLNFYVNRSCGLHLHIDGAGIIPASVRDQRASPKILKNLMFFYYFFDDVIFSFLPASRRTNQYCMPVNKNYSESEIKNCKTFDDFEKLWYKEPNKDSRESRKRNKYDNSRYTGLNLHSLLKDGHLEVRYHSGTINGVKLLYWAYFNLFIIDNIVSGKITETKIRKLATDKMSRDSSRIYEVFDFLRDIGFDESARDYFIKRYTAFNHIVAPESVENEVENNVRTYELDLSVNRIKEYCVNDSGLLVRIMKSGDITDKEFETFNQLMRANGHVLVSNLEGAMHNGKKITLENLDDYLSTKQDFEIYWFERDYINNFMGVIKHRKENNLQIINTI